MTRIEMPIIKMTREEVIKTLKEHKIMFGHDFGWDITTLKALDVAISVLSIEPCTDCISRNDVTKMLNTMDRYTADKLKLCDTDKEFPHNEVFIVDDVYEGLDLLPSVQPVIPNMTITVDGSYMRNVRKDCGLYE